MTHDDILALVKAGYSKTDIDKMDTQNNNVASTTQKMEGLNPQPIVYQTQPYMTAPPQYVMYQQAPPQQAPMYNYQTFVDQARRDNILNSQQPPEVTPEQIMANVINPGDVKR